MTSCLLNGGPYGESKQDTGSGHWNPWCVLRVMIDHYQQAQAEFYLPSNQCWGSGALVGIRMCWASRIRILLSSSKNSKKNLDFYCFETSLWLFIFEDCLNVSRKGKKQNNFGKKYLFVDIKSHWRKGRIWSQIRVRIRNSVVRISRAGSVLKCHGSTTLQSSNPLLIDILSAAGSILLCLGMSVVVWAKVEICFISKIKRKMLAVLLFSVRKGWPSLLLSLYTLLLMAGSTPVPACIPRVRSVTEWKFIIAGISRWRRTERQRCAKCE
jgi:hypothetical protein